MLKLDSPSVAKCSVREPESKEVVVNVVNFATWTSVEFRRDPGDDKILKGQLPLVYEKARNVLSYSSMRLMELTSPMTITLYDWQDNSVSVKIVPARPDSIKSLCVKKMRLKLAFETGRGFVNMLTADKVGVNDSGEPQFPILAQLEFNFDNWCPSSSSSERETKMLVAVYLDFVQHMDKEISRSILNIRNAIRDFLPISITVHDDKLVQGRRNAVLEHSHVLVDTIDSASTEAHLHLPNVQEAHLKSILRLIQDDDFKTVVNMGASHLLGMYPIVVAFDVALVQRVLHEKLMNLPDQSFMISDLMAILKFPRRVHYKAIRTKAIKIVNALPKDTLVQSQSFMNMLEENPDITIEIFLRRQRSKGEEEGPEMILTGTGVICPSEISALANGRAALLW